MSVTMDYDPPLFQAPEGNEFSQVVPSEDKDFMDAKAYLLQTSALTGLNLYDHLSNILRRVLDERPCNAADILEELSKQEKRNKFTLHEDNILNKPDRTTEVALAEIQKRLFSRGGTGGDAEGSEDDDEDEADPEEDENSPLPDLMQMCFYFEQAGVGLNREEMVRIWLAMKSLVAAHSFTSIRFWGKIFGIEQNYIVVEGQLADGEEEDDEGEEEEAEEGEEEVEKKVKLDADEDDEDEEEEEEDAPPKINFKPPPVVPKEERGSGVNKMTYYVCNEPGKRWIKLPTITPAHIDVARTVKKFFTGRLDAPIICYPPFEGREAHYLRAQIARISAGTQVSPLGFYQFDEDEEPDEGEIRENVSANEEYEPMGVRELIDPELSNWVHHTLHILPQGRVKWWNPKDAADDEDVDPDDDEEKDDPEEIEPEVGPPLLTPLSEDANLNGMPAWTTRISSKLVPKYAVAVIHSCLWPGAHAFASGKTFENIYIGWGHKYSVENFNPVLPPPIQTEFPSGPEITEADDPTAEQEAEYRKQHEEEEEEEEEEEDDDEGDVTDED